MEHLKQVDFYRGGDVLQVLTRSGDVLGEVRKDYI